MEDEVITWIKRRGQSAHSAADEHISATLTDTRTRGSASPLNLAGCWHEG